MRSFYCNGSRITEPTDIIPFLGSGEKHWKKGRSAYELSHSWMDADGVPAPIREVLEKVSAFSSPKLVEGHFERETDIPGRGRPSQTDLLALCEAAGTRFILGVEGKVDETLGPLVEDWDTGSKNKGVRLSGLIDLLGRTGHEAGRLRYQLLHRTASALLEARIFDVSRTVMIVHSFDPNHAWFDDFVGFSEWLGAPCSRPGDISEPINRDGIELYIGWCADRPLP